MAICSNAPGWSEPPTLYIRDEARRKARRVLEAKVHLCAWQKKEKEKEKERNHSDASAEGWVNTSYLDHTHAHAKIITAPNTGTYLLLQTHTHAPME